MPFRLPFASARSPSGSSGGGGGGGGGPQGGSSTTVPLPPVSPTRSTGPSHPPAPSPPRKADKTLLDPVPRAHATRPPEQQSLQQVAAPAAAAAGAQGSAQGSDPAPPRPAAAAAAAGALAKLSLDSLPPYPASLGASSRTTLSLGSTTPSSGESTEDGVARGSSSAFTSAASSVSSLHASDDDRAAAAAAAWDDDDNSPVEHRKANYGSECAVGGDELPADQQQQQQQFLQVGERASLEEDTPRAERPPVLGASASKAPDAEAAAVVGASEKGFGSLLPPSYFPYSADEAISPRSEVPPTGPASQDDPSQTASSTALPDPQAASAPTTRPSFGPSSLPSMGSRVAAPPSAFRSPSFPPPSRPPPTAASSRSGGAARALSHNVNPSVSTASTSGHDSSWRSSIFSSASSSSASSFSSSSSCSVSTPVLPRPWLAGDQLLDKVGSTDMRDEDALLVETTDESYVVVACLPGFSLDCITLATKSRRTLHIVADRWERENSAHFERKVTFGQDADLARIRAQFDGEMLRVTVLRRPVPSSSAPSFTSIGGDHPVLPPPPPHHHRASAPAPLSATAAKGGDAPPWATTSSGERSPGVYGLGFSRGSAPGLLDSYAQEMTAKPAPASSFSSSSSSTAAAAAAAGGLAVVDGSASSTIRARGPDDAASRILAQAGLRREGLDEILARAQGRDGSRYL